MFFLKNVQLICRSIIIASLLSLTVASPLAAADVMQLTLRGAIDIALIYNLNLQVNRIEPAVSRERVISEISVFDSEVALSGEYVQTQLKYNDPYYADSHYSIVEASISKTFPFGTQVSLDIAQIADTQNKEAPFESCVRKDTQTSFSFTQPLLKNRGTSINRHYIQLARNDHKKTALSFKETVIETVAETQKRYWQLYLAIKNMDVHKKSLELAKTFQAEVEEDVRRGKSDSLNILQSEAEVASREAEAIGAENSMLNRADQLLSYIYGETAKHVQVICNDSPTFEVIHVNEDELIAKALNVRTDYRSNRYDLEVAESEVRYARNQRLPQLDLNGSLMLNNGNVREGLDVIDTPIDYYEGTLTFSLRFPWRFRQDSAYYRMKVLERNRLRLRQKEISANIRLEIRTAIRNVRLAHKRYLAADLANRLAEKKLTAEQEKYKKGQSTSYKVLLYQRDFTDASVSLIDAVIDYQLAIVELNKTAGITLEENNIRLAKYFKKAVSNRRDTENE